MARGICIYAEHSAGQLEPVVMELLTAAHQLKAQLREPIQVLLTGASVAAPLEQLKQLAVDEIYVATTPDLGPYSDDAHSAVLAELLRRVAPGNLLLPASAAGRSLFSRVAASLETGMTADCTELRVVRQEDGTCLVLQNKPSFGESIFVSMANRPGFEPQMTTIRQGVFAPWAGVPAESPAVTEFTDIAVPTSGVELLELLPQADSAGALLGADVVVVGGRGALSEENLPLLQQFARGMNAPIGGTRPMVDEGAVPFEHQIGQTGCTIRPKICLSFGVSGAIQHTEGIRDTKLFIAVNSDENAPIFSQANYGVAADMKDILTALNQMMLPS